MIQYQAGDRVSILRSKESGEWLSGTVYRVKSMGGLRQSVSVRTDDGKTGWVRYNNGSIRPLLAVVKDEDESEFQFTLTETALDELQKVINARKENG